MRRDGPGAFGVRSCWLNAEVATREGIIPAAEHTLGGCEIIMEILTKSHACIKEGC